MTAPAMDMQTLLRALMQNAQSAPVEAPKKKKRKRGGLAGLWDRNKGVIKPIVTGALGAIGGPLGVGLATGAGALMGGLDRPGKRGIGFDVGGAASGGAAGYAAGSAGRYLGGKVGIKPMLGKGAASTAAPVAKLSSPDMLDAVPQATKPFTSVGAPPVPQARGLGSALRGVGSFVKQNPEAVGMGLQGAGAVMGAQAERSIADERLRLERERDEEERRRRGLTASLLLPMYQQQMQRFQP